VRIKEALAVLLAMACLALGLTAWRFDWGTKPKTVPFVLQLNWRAQAETGGFAQAVAKGFYRECGIEVELRQGGPGIDPRQLLVSGAVDAALVPQNVGILQMNRAGFAARGIFTSLQHTPASIIVHAQGPIQSIAQIQGKPIFLSASTRAGWWQFMKKRYGFSDSQIRAFAGQHTAFIENPNAISQDVITNGPYIIQAKAGMPVRSFRISDLGYDPYDSILTVSQKLIDTRPQAVRCLVQGSQRGWLDFMRNPDAGYALIRQMSPEVTQGLLTFAHKVMKENALVENDDTRKLGIGAMTRKRWREHAQMLSDIGLIAPGTDLDTGLDTRFITSGR
jgi:NitT/TauT family transport system substrate-binding protein